MAQAYGLYTHIQSNRRRSVILIVWLFCLVYLMVFAGALLAEAMLGDASLQWLLNKAWRDTVQALPWATLGTLVWIFIAYKFHQKLIDAMTGGIDTTRQEDPRLWNLLENLCISRGIPMPKLKIVEDSALNAFATGLNEKQYAISVTTGLLDRLDDAELEGVLGHELTHIRNGDVRLLVVATVMAGVIAFFGEFVFRMFFQAGLGWRGRRSSSGDSDRKGSGGALPAIIIAFALIAVAWVLSLVIKFALSRSREYLADAGAVELTKNPDAMITALRKIEGRGDLETANSAVMEMCIDNPRTGFSNLFDTHPSVDKRVEALVRYAGGHDPGPIALPPPQDSEDDQPADEQEPTQQHRPGFPGGIPGLPGGIPGLPGGIPGLPGIPGGGDKPFLPQRPPVDLGSGGGDKPFLPERPPVDLGGPKSSPTPSDTGSEPPPPGPWSPRR